MAPAVLILLACLAYSNADHDRLFLDSTRLAREPGITDAWGAARRLWHSGLRPGQDLTLLSFAVNCAINTRCGLAGLDISGFLVVNVFLHALNTLLAYAIALSLIRRSTPSRAASTMGAALAAAMFAVHPLHVSNVVYIIQRTALLSALFYLIALLAYLWLRSARTTAPMAAWGIVLAAAFFLSMKSGTDGLTIPFAVLALEACLSVPDALGRRHFIKYGLPAALVCAVGISALAALGGLFDLHRFQFVGESNNSSGVFQQFLTQMVVIAGYWKLILLPWGSWLCMDHTTFAVTSHAGDVLACSVLHAALLVMAVVAAWRGWLLAGFGLLLFYIALLPYLIVPQTEQFAEYRTYLSTVGVAFVLVELFNRSRMLIGRLLPAVSAILIAGSFLLITRHRNLLFKDPIAFWQDIAVKYPTNLRASVSLGESYAEVGRYREAMDAFRRAGQLKPYDALLHFYMGNTLRAWGRLTDAVSEYREARRIAGGDLHIAVNLSEVLTKLDRVDESYEVLRSGIAQAWGGTDPSVMAKARFNLGNMYATARRWDEAEKQYREAIVADPNYANAYQGRAVALDEQGRSAEAIEALYAALRLKPDFPDARRTLEIILQRSTDVPAPSNQRPSHSP